MKQQIYAPNTVPTAGIAVNKSRMKLYKNSGNLPVYYLQSGQEFQIELFNPTSDVVLAKIVLNGKPISQGGLVLKPGIRIFLDRYLDVAKKFLFDTYEVANTSEVKKAIEDNGDIKVEFYRETKSVNNYYPITYPTYIYQNWNGLYNYPNYNTPLYGTTAIGGSGFGGTLTTTTAASGTLNIDASSTSYNASSNNACYTNTLGVSDEVKDFNIPVRSRKLSKTIETGRVEEGSYSDQSFKSVSMNFDYSPFHTVEYKMLPISQKVNTIDDINVKRYCTSCGAKLGKTDRFCSSCGKKG